MIVSLTRLIGCGAARSLSSCTKPDASILLACALKYLVAQPGEILPIAAQLQCSLPRSYFLLSVGQCGIYNQLTVRYEMTSQLMARCRCGKWADFTIKTPRSSSTRPLLGSLLMFCLISGSALPSESQIRMFHFYPSSPTGSSKAVLIGIASLNLGHLG